MRIIGNIKLAEIDEEEMICNGRETIILRPGQIKVWITAREVIKK